MPYCQNDENREHSGHLGEGRGDDPEICPLCCNPSALTMTALETSIASSSLVTSTGASTVVHLLFLHYFSEGSRVYSLGPNSFDVYSLISKSSHLSP